MIHHILRDIGFVRRANISYVFTLLNGIKEAEKSTETSIRER